MSRGSASSRKNVHRMYLIEPFSGVLRWFLGAHADENEDGGLMIKRGRKCGFDCTATCEPV